jgi:integrase/recombinase XerC
VEETLQQFRAWLRRQDRSPRTVQAYTSDLRHFARWFPHSNGKPPAPEPITPIDVREYRQWMITVKDLAPATVNRRLAALRAFASWAYIAGLIATDPTEKIQLVEEQQSPPRWLDRREQAALQRALARRLEHAELKARLAELEDRPTPADLIWARRDAAIVQLMLGAGLRAGEVAALKVADVEVRDRSGQVTVRLGKGNKHRTVPLNADVRAEVAAWLAVRPEIDAKALFVSRRGKGLGRRALQRVVEKLGKEADVEETTPHVLRHSFAKNLVDAGVGLEKVADLMGHSRLETTRIYTRPSKRDREQAAESVALR